MESFSLTAATAAFMSGKLKIKGNMGLAMKLEKLMKQMPKAPASGAGSVEETFKQVKSMLNEQMVKDVGGVFKFTFKGTSFADAQCS